jgi:hypothetical protein
MIIIIIICLEQYLRKAQSILEARNPPDREYILLLQNQEVYCCSPVIAEPSIYT